MRHFSRLIVLSAAVSLVACVNIPLGPSVMVLPGVGKNFDQFRGDDYLCRQFANQQTNYETPKNSAVSSGMESAALGAALGAAAGAALGGGRGAAVGAGMGLLGGGLAGSGTAQSSGSISQERYDIAYIQCMYANGHRVPVSAGLIEGSGGNMGQGVTSSPSSSSGRSIPPPPPGHPPPPPPY